MLAYFLISTIFLSGSGLASFSDLPTVLQADSSFAYAQDTQTKADPPVRFGESLGVTTTATVAAVFDVQSEAPLFEKEADKVVPIASITKLMTALVFLENNPGLDKSANVTASDNTLIGAKLRVPNGEAVKVIDLFFTSLTGSANNATQALVHSTGLSGEEFVVKMNAKAKELGMQNTHFVEPTGLSEENVSTANDLFILAKAAFTNQWISQATTKTNHELVTVTNNEYHNVKSQNDILDSYLDVQGSKTGFTYEAGYCLITQVKGEQGQQVIAVVLGSESENSRFLETKALSQWAFENYQW